jgi:outer membrane protein assembly factor BamB
MLRLLRIVLTVACVALLAADWPQFQGPTRNGISTEKGLVATWPKKGPPILWEREVGDGFSAPVVVGESLILYHAVQGEDLVECLDAATGKPRWKDGHKSGYRDDYGKGDGPRTTPLAADGKVCTLGPLGRLTCHDLATGKKLWHRDLLEDFQATKGFFGVGAGLLADGGVLIVNIGGKPGAGIVGLDLATGKDVWKATDHEGSYSAPIAATIDGVRHGLFFTREGLVSLDPKSGEVRFSRRWRSRMNASVNAATPVVSGGLVFLTASYGTGALLAKVKKDGVEEVWKSDEVLSSQYNTPVLVNGHLYGIDGRADVGAARLVCVEFRTGKLKWAEERFGCASIVSADGKLIALADNGDLVMFEPTPEAYREKARASVLAAPVRMEMALANGRLYARDGKRLVCFKLSR